MKNYLDFEKEIKALEQEVDSLSPFGAEEFQKLILIRSKTHKTKLIKVREFTLILIVGKKLK